MVAPTNFVLNMKCVLRNSARHELISLYKRCSVVREINKINDAELNLGTTSASWHEEYKGTQVRCSVVEA